MVPLIIPVKASSSAEPGERRGWKGKNFSLHPSPISRVDIMVVVPVPHLVGGDPTVQGWNSGLPTP